MRKKTKVPAYQRNVSINKLVPQDFLCEEEAVAAEEAVRVAVPSGSGSVEVPVHAFMGLLRRHALPDEPPIDYVVEEVVLKGDTLKERATFHATVRVNVLTDAWVSIPFFSQEVALTKIKVDGPGDEADLGPCDDAIELMTHKKGQYTVEVDLECPLHKTRGRGLTVRVPKAVRNSLEFRVPEDNIDIKVNPSLASTLASDEGSTTVTCAFPPASSLAINWTVKLVEEEEEEEKEVVPEEVIVTASQQVTHSIGEGMLMSSAQMTYHIVHGTRSLLEVAVPNNVRIISVEGDALKRWEHVDARALAAAAAAAATPTADSGSDGESDGEDGAAGTGAGSFVQVDTPTAAAVEGKVLRVFLDYGVEGKYSLHFVTERSMTSTSSQVDVPAFACRDVNRQKGFISVEALTNVEISEQDCGGLSPIDTSELPRAMSRGEGTALLAYKFLQPNINLRLDVKKHSDVSVLIAIADEAWLEVTWADSKLLVRVKLVMRNTQKQFVKCSLPSEECQIWSTVVDGRSVKPARDEEDDSVLIPLKKSERGKEKPFVVELVYMQPVAKMAERGEFGMAFPTFDVNIAYLFLTMFVPKLAKYGEFEFVNSSLKEVRSFSRSQPAEAKQQAWGGAPGAPQMQQQQMNMYDSCDSCSEEEDYGRRSSLTNIVSQSNVLFSKSSMAKPRSRAAKLGVVPVKIADLKVGTSFRFEELLVNADEERRSLTVEYKEDKDADGRKKRKLDSGWCAVM